MSHLQKDLVVNLDGVRTGIFAYVPEDDNPLTVKERITFGQRKSWLFRNYDVMMSSLINNHYKLNNIRFAFKYGKDDYMSFDEFQMIDGAYVGFYEGQRITIVPETSRRVSRVYYLVIEQENSDLSEYELQKETFKLFRKVAKTIPGLYCGTAEIVPFDENGFFEIKMVDNTVRLHIGSTSKIAQLNKARIQEEKPCIPFIKDIPKYTSLYIYGDKDMYEPIEYDSIIDIMVKDLVEQTNHMFPHVKAYAVNCEIRKKLIL